MTTSRSSATKVILTPAQVRRLEAVGWPVGDMALAEWLTIRAEVAAPGGEAASIHRLRAERDEAVREAERVREILAVAGRIGTRIAWESHDGAPCVVVTGPADMEREIATAAAESWDAMMSLIAEVARDRACSDADAQRGMVLELRGERAELRAEVERLRRYTEEIASKYALGIIMDEVEAHKATKVEIERLQARVRTLQSRILALVEVGSGRLPHQYRGLCPDEVEGHDSRDPDCRACEVLIGAVADVQEAGDG